MGKKSISYSAVILDYESRIKLIDAITIPSDYKLVAHHCTICLSSLPEDWKDRIGEKVELKGQYFGKTDKVIAFKIDNFKRLMNGQAHITVATSPIGKPKDSNEITNWNMKLRQPLVLFGTIQEISN